MLKNTRFGIIGSAWDPHYDRFLTQDSRYKPTIFEIIQQAASIDGLSGIELIHPWQVQPENVAEIKTAMNDAGLETAAVFASISSKEQFIGGALVSDHPAARREAIDTIKTALDLAVELDTKHVNIWLGRDGFDYPFQIDYDQAWGRLVSAFKEFGAYRPEIEIGIEYKIKEPRKWLLVSTAAKLLVLAQDVGLPNIGALLDTGHALWAYENLGEVVSMLARENRLFSIHFNDNTRLWDDDLVVGTVHFVEFLEMLYWLDRVGYQGWFSFDPFAHLENPTRCVEESVRTIQGMIGVLDRIGKPKIEAAIATRDITEILALIRAQIFRTDP